MLCIDFKHKIQSKSGKVGTVRMNKDGQRISNNIKYLKKDQNEFAYKLKKPGWHGNSVVSTVISQQEDPGINF